MTDEDFVFDAMRAYGEQKAQSVQAASSGMSGTELNAQDDFIPDFSAAKEKMNMLERHAGMTDGFVCKSGAGRVVRLLQNYDSDIFTAEPEELPAQWGFVWSQDPAKAKPFIAMATSPYMTGDCCYVETGDDGGDSDKVTYRSLIDNNVWSPTDYPQGWEKAL